MKIETLKLSALHPMERNVRKHSQKQISEYIRSIDKFGQTKPMVVDENGMILIGNGLYEAMVAMQHETADCYVMRGLSEKDKKKLMLSDNRIFELGMTDTDVFEQIIRELEGDTDVPGWDADLLDTLNASINEVNEMVDSYGNYQPEDIAKISSRTPVPQVSQENELQQPPAAVTEEGQRNTYPTAQPEVEAPQRPEERYVICPKCGERICL